MDGITSIMLKEAMQICVGQEESFVTQIFGEPDTVYQPATEITCPRCAETLYPTYWYYDGFAFVLHHDSSAYYVCYWGFTA